MGLMGISTSTISKLCKEIVERVSALLERHGELRAGGVPFRKNVYRAMEELHIDLDEWMRHYNEARTHQGRWCFGKTPMQTFLDSKPLAREKQKIGEAA